MGEAANRTNLALVGHGNLVFVLVGDIVQQYRMGPSSEGFLGCSPLFHSPPLPLDPSDVYRMQSLSSNNTKLLKEKI